MKIKKLFGLLGLSAVLSLVPAMVSAQSATNSAVWTSGITYQNTTGASGIVTVNMYDDAGASYATASMPLAPYGSGTVQVGTVSTVPALPVSYQGSAVLSSDVNIAATYVQYDNAAQYGRMFYKSFTSSNASNNFYVSTFLKSNFGFTSKVGVQNVSASTASVTVKFISAATLSVVHTETRNVPSQASFIFSGKDIAALGAAFNGSVEISSNQPVVAVSEETEDDGRAAYAFEGVAGGATKVNVPTMLCNFDGGGGVTYTSYYAIQAVGAASNFKITHYDKTGAQVGMVTDSISASGGKKSKNPCADGVPSGAIGSSVIEATSGQLIVIVKVVGSNGLRTAYVAEATGATKVALPYVRWSTVDTGYRTYVAAMNVSATSATVTAKYYNEAGTLVATHSLGTVLPGSKVNTQWQNASGSNTAFTGSVIIESTQPVLVTARSQAVVSLGTVTNVGEDYTGIPAP
jgi:hypothetical protein